MNTESRIPKFTGSAKEWAISMYKSGLAFHIDDNPRDITSLETNVATFTEAECVELDAIVEAFSAEDTELYFETVIDLTNNEVDQDSIVDNFLDEKSTSHRA